MKLSKGSWALFGKGNNIIPSELVLAYKRTDFKVLEPRPFTLQVGSYSPELASLYSQMKTSSAGYLTAWNPYSVGSSHEDNQRSQEALLRKLSLEGFTTLSAFGVDPSGDWPGETSVLAPGLDLERTKSLGNEFAQNAVLWIGDDAVPQLILLR